MKKTIFLFLFLFLSSPLEAACDLRVTRVVDGDTFKATTVTVISPSLHITEETGFRLLRVDTPERKEPGYGEAKTYLRDMIEGKLIEVRLIDKKRKRDSFGRFLVEIFTCGPGGKLNVNDELIKKGWPRE